jgi:hypothetical protein
MQHAVLFSLYQLVALNSSWQAAEHFVQALVVQLQLTQQALPEDEPGELQVFEVVQPC